MRSLSRCRTIALPLVTLALGAAACSEGPAGEGAARLSQPIINPSTPATTAPSTSDLAPLDVVGTFAQAGPSGAPAAAGQFTSLTDLDLDPTPITSTTGLVSASAWLGQVSSYATAPDFAADLSSAASYAISQAQPNPSDVTAVWTSAITDIFGSPNVQSAGQSFYGWTPVAARYIASQWGSTRTCEGKICFTNATQYQYPDPPDLEEQRERGARLYCAARAAQKVQGSNTIVMGEEAAVSFGLLGQQIQLFAVEPMVSIDGPQQYTSATADGAQAFAAPLKFGTRITPIKGFGLPSLPEIRYAAALVSGDSEVATQAAYETLVVNGVERESVYTKDYVTVEHMDGYVAGATSAHSSNTFLLFTIGPVDIDLTLGLTIDSGLSQIAQGRLLQDVNDGSVLTRTTLQETSAFMDGPWLPKDSGPGALFGPFDAEPGNVALDTVSFPQAFFTRASQNDDHYLQGGDTHLQLDTSLAGTAGLAFGPVQVDLQVTGSITGSVDQIQMVRDAAFAQVPHGTSGLVPATGLVVRPRTEANVTLGPLAATLDMSLDLGLFTASWSVQLFSTGTVPLANYDSDTTNAWPASSHLRIGTGSGLGADIRNQPTVDTQLPNGAPFQALPEAVNACLTDTTPNPPNAGACTSTPPAPGGPPSTNLCVYENNENLCSTIGSTTSMPVPTSPEQCGLDIMRYLCSITPHVGGTGSQISSVMTSASLTAIGNELYNCGKAEANAGFSQAETEAYLQGLARFTPCDASGNPITQIFTAPSPTAPPPVTTGASCN